MDTKSILCVQAGARKKVYVTFEQDTIPNKGGYYCQTFHDPECTIPTTMSFTIQNHLLRGASDKLKLAKSIANEKVKKWYYIN
jgi:hypothetical protein